MVHLNNHHIKEVPPLAPHHEGHTSVHGLKRGVGDQEYLLLLLLQPLKQGDKLWIPEEKKVEM